VIGFLFCIEVPPPGAPSSSKILDNSGNWPHPGWNPYSLNSGKNTIRIRFGTQKRRKLKAYGEAISQMRQLKKSLVNSATASDGN
jgi:hypothetical protein